MKKNNGGKNSRELLLFHGTDSKYLDSICKDNFDWRLCGKNGTIYGEGEACEMRNLNETPFTLIVSPKR